MLLPDYLLLCSAAAAVLFDLSSDRIPNVLIAAAASSLLVLRCCREGAAAIPSCLGGAAVPFLLLYPFFLFRLVGAGDIKLLMALGIRYGAEGSLRLLFLSLVCGLIFGILRILSARLAQKRQPGRRPSSASRIHFSAPVFAAAAILTGGLI